MRPLSLTTAVVVVVFVFSSVMLFRLSKPPATPDSLRAVSVHHFLPPDDATEEEAPSKAAPAAPLEPINPPAVAERPVPAPVPTPSRFYATVVASYFQLPQSKHNAANYDQWLQMLFERARGPFVIYCSPREHTRIKEWRRAFPDTTKFVIVDDFWSLPPCTEFKADLEAAHAMDPEKNIHNPSLYCLWFAKLYMLKQVVESNPFNSDFFFYADAGSFRDKNKVFHDFNWPDQSADSHWRTQLTTTVKDHFLLEMVYPYHYANRANAPVDPDVGTDGHRNASCAQIAHEHPWSPTPQLAGGFFGGSPALVKLYAANFFALAREWADRKVFIGKDQNLMNQLYRRAGYNGVAKQAVIPAYTVQYCGDRWFLFQLTFAALKDTRAVCQPDFVKVPHCLE